MVQNNPKYLYADRVGMLKKLSTLTQNTNLFVIADMEATTNDMWKTIDFQSLVNFIMLVTGLSGLRYGKELLVPGVNTITFNTPVNNANWIFVGIPFCTDSANNLVSPDIINRTANGFDVDIGDNGIIEYIILNF